MFSPIHEISWEEVLRVSTSTCRVPEICPPTLDFSTATVNNGGLGCGDGGQGNSSHGGSFLRRSAGCRAQAEEEKAKLGFLGVR